MLRIDLVPLLTKCNVFPSSAEGQKKAHLILAWVWFAFGVFGLIEYILYLRDHPDEAVHAFRPVANSIPILFFISVYANFVGHLSSAQAARAEINVSVEAPQPSKNRKKDT